MKRLALVMFATLIAGCSNSSVDESKTSSVDGQPVDQNPQVDKDPTAKSTTGGDQQGMQPAQPAAPRK